MLAIDARRDAAAHVGDDDVDLLMRFCLLRHWIGRPGAPLSNA